MKANELRIGNWVSQYGLEFKITLKDFTKPDLLPIPLTEEWLLKFGFKKHHQSFYDETLCVREVEYLWFYNIYPLENSIIPLVNMSAQATGHYIKYVHQFQNLYFALTGEELKTIKR